MFVKNGEKATEETTDGFTKHSKAYIVEVSQKDVLNFKTEEKTEEKNIEKKAENAQNFRTICT